MPISINYYVDITSGVGSAANFGTRDLIGRFFTTNALVPTNSVVTFDSASEVADYFGSTSDEYKRAAFYFSYISKSITAPQKIAFARWADVATAPQIFGAKGAQSLASYTSITTGTFTLSLGGTSLLIGPMNFSAAGSLAAVASIVQAAIVAAGTGALWDNATVAWDATRQSFSFTGGAVGANAISIVAGTGGSDVAAQLGWLSASTIISAGVAAQTLTTLLSTSSEGDNNFGSFAFVPTLTSNQILEAATWNDTQNNQFMYSAPCSVSNAAALSASLLNLSGVTLTLSPLSTEYPEQVPMMILAATQYTARNSVLNYMFNSFNLTPSVTTNAGKDTYDALRVNYYGNVQQAGTVRSFYQNGYMMGLPTDAVDQNVYANEIWFKDAATVTLMNLLLAVTELPANSAGRGMVLNQMQDIIDLALFNGTIEAGKALVSEQKLFITNVTGNPLAWIQVQNSGYWIDANVVVYQEDGVTKYKIVYVLIYSKNDVIRKVEGSDILI